MIPPLLHKKHFLLDIETSGLNKHIDYIVCIGVTFVNETDELTHHQWMLQLPEEEKEILSCFLEFTQRFSHVYTYGGKHFDWPFLLARCTFHQLNPSMLQSLHLIDMKKSLQHFGATRINLEDALGVIRHSTTSGKALVKVYRTYQACGETIYKTIILAHNKDELSTLLSFYELYQTLYHLKHFHFIDTLKSSVSLDFSAKVPYLFTTNFQGCYKNITLCWESGTQILGIKVAFSYLKLKQYLTPYKDYYYIPSQGQLLHRTLAHFVASSDKRKATKEECTIYKEDDYIPLYTTYKLDIPIWYDSVNSPYLRVNDFSASILAAQVFYLLFSNKKTS